MNQLLALKKILTNDPKTAEMIKPSARNEIFLDWDKNGTIDFAFISSKNDGQIDTFALDMTGDGLLDLYFYDADGNGIADDVRYYPANSDTPSHAFSGKELEDSIEPIFKKVGEVFQAEFNADNFVGALRDIKAQLLAYGNQLETNGTLGIWRGMLKANPDTAKLIMPSARNEIYLDLNADGLADFAFISSKNDNNLDTFAIDTTKNGEFNLYLLDTDGNGIADDVRYYEDGAEEPKLTYTNIEKVEAALRDCTVKFTDTLRKGVDAATLVDALNTYKNDIIALKK